VGFFGDSGIPSEKGYTSKFFNLEVGIENYQHVLTTACEDELGCVFYLLNNNAYLSIL
jgi:hypothetical protein